ncbi:MAG: hypothetical protein B5M52_07910 [Helicobacteraceae bacterium 4484_230]|nr:MAG: hypothetical protein B5M52_07910 [Helicobacteraceae bacterium 4484_230]
MVTEFKSENKALLAISTFFTLLFTLIVGSGCASGPDVSNDILVGNYKAAADAAAAEKDTDSELDEANLLPTLQAGNLYLYAKEYDTSLKMLDEAERIVKYHNEEILLGSTGDMIARLMLNDAVIDYHATITDAVMVNTYKSLDYMILGQFADARVELNRAVDRQRRAKETYAELIGKQKEAINQKAKEESSSYNVNKTISNPQLARLIKDQYPGLYTFQAYPDFINPFTTYLAGLFFLIESDYNKAYSLLKEAYGMMPENRILKTDYEMAKARYIDDNYVWVIYENGLSPIKKEYRVDIPLFIVSDHISYTGIALPRMEMRPLATVDLMISDKNGMLGKTETVADMDRVILTEFHYTYPDIVTRAVFSALIKTAMQYELGKQNSYAGFAAALFQMASTQADTRTWRSIPKEFQVARVKMPANHKLLLRSGMHNIEAEINRNAKHAIIYVRIPTANSRPSYTVINF